MVRPLYLAIAAALAAGPALAQTSHTKLTQRDGNPASGDGRCQIRVQVDDTALLRMRGDNLWVETIHGDRAFDEGSSCNQPLSRDARDFRITYDRGRGRVQEVQVPSARNDYTGTIEVHDPQNGAGHYVIDVSWTNPRVYSDVRHGNGYSTAYIGRDPAPGFDPLRACQEQVRAEFVRRNAGDAYLEFSGTPGSEVMGADRHRVYGEAFARNRSSTRQVNYECVLDNRGLRVENIAYNVEGTRGAMR